MACKYYSSIGGALNSAQLAGTMGLKAGPD